MEVISKRVMSPMRIRLLTILKERWESDHHSDKEMNAMALHNRSGYKLDLVNRAIDKMGPLGLIKFTGGGFFTISSKGLEYLGSLK